MKTQTNLGQGNRRNPETTITMIVKAPIDQAFHYIAPINLMHIFRGNALIPAIVNTSVKEGWNRAGLVRTVYFKDGSTSQESLLTMNVPTSFSYKNEHFSSLVLSALLQRLEGEWLFTDLGNDRTQIDWTYRAIPTNLLASLVVRLVLMRAVRSMLVDALTITKDDLESGQLAGGTTWTTQPSEQGSDTSLSIAEQPVLLRN
ncbi:SRPBCC family protein [Spirosoma endophyticum]|uniref:Polyketide cyclase / dehydrase and lipid transport n=1 Tax=Spirosoma endophyticum TaxID=662367 RepID=A0A1I2DVU4_9BACT|nr:SRPBCC family protein [Spirosoma endophyticum]SFE84459.1 Polyketide cyclase / dehydrase and lipid transport [Spirosoma endophyticum]